MSNSPTITASPVKFTNLLNALKVTPEKLNEAFNIALNNKTVDEKEEYSQKIEEVKRWFFEELTRLQEIFDKIWQKQEYKTLFTQYAMLIWMQDFLQMRVEQEDEDSQEILKEVMEVLFVTHKKFGKFASNSDKAWTFTYILLTAVDMVMEFASGHVITNDQQDTILGSSWSAIDFINGAILGKIQYCQGEERIGLANILNSVQMIVSTAIADTLMYLPLAVKHAGFIASNLFGWSFVASMCIAGVIEVREFRQCNKRKAVFHDKLEEDLNLPVTQGNELEEALKGSLQRLRKTKDSIELVTQGAIIKNQIRQYLEFSSLNVSEKTKAKIARCNIYLDNIALENGRARDHQLNARWWLAGAVVMAGISACTTCLGTPILDITVAQGLAMAAFLIKPILHFRFWGSSEENVKMLLIQKANEEKLALQSPETYNPLHANNSNNPLVTASTHTSSATFSPTASVDEFVGDPEQEPLLVPSEDSSLSMGDRGFFRRRGLAVNPINDGQSRPGPGISFNRKEE